MVELCIQIAAEDPRPNREIPMELAGGGEGISVTLNIYEQAILRLLKTARRPLTTSQVAEKLGISWETARSIWRCSTKAGMSR